MNRKHTEVKKFASNDEKQAEIKRLAKEIDRHFHFFTVEPLSEREQMILEAQEQIEKCFSVPVPG